MYNISERSMCWLWCDALYSGKWICIWFERENSFFSTNIIETETTTKVGEIVNIFGTVNNACKAMFDDIIKHALELSLFDVENWARAF